MESDCVSLNLICNPFPPRHGLGAKRAMAQELCEVHHCGTPEPEGKHFRHGQLVTGREGKGMEFEHDFLLMPRSSCFPAAVEGLGAPCHFHE